MQILDLLYQCTNLAIELVLLVLIALDELVLFDVAASVGVDLSKNVVDDSGDVIRVRLFQVEPVGELLPRDLPTAVAVYGAELLVQSPRFLLFLKVYHLFK